VWDWNAQAATVSSDSSNLVQRVVSAVSGGAYLSASVAVQTAPVGTVAYSIPGDGSSTDALDATVPVPLGTRPGASDDHHLAVLDANGREHDMWSAHYDATTQHISSVGGGASFPIGSVSEPRPGGATAARFPLVRGLITPSDIRAGVINHPLVFSLPVGTVSGGTKSAYPSDTDYNGYPVFGQWYRLDPTLDCNALGLDSFNTMLCVALQKYGMFNRDIGSLFAIYGQDMVNQGGNGTLWPFTLPVPNSSGYPFALKLGAIPWSRLQALNPPPAS